MLLSKNDIVSRYNISERTFDRYRKKLKFETFRQGRIIMFDEKEIQQVMGNLLSEQHNASKTNITAINDNPPNTNPISVLQNNIASKESIANNKLSNKISNDYLEYLKKDLEHFKKELSEKNQMIESANYKVGKLESIVNMYNNIIGEYESNKMQVIEMRLTIDKQKNDLKSLKINFFIVIVFAFILIMFEIYLFLNILKIV